LTNPLEFDLVQQTIEGVRKEMHYGREASGSGPQAWKFMESFSEFALRFSGIVEILLPQSPEYTVTYGVVIILFKVRHDG